MQRATRQQKRANKVSQTEDGAPVIPDVPHVELYDGEDVFTAIVSSKNGKIFIPGEMHKAFAKLIRERNKKAEESKVDSFKAYIGWAEATDHDRKIVAQGNPDPQTRFDYLDENADEIYTEVAVLLNGVDSVRIDLAEINREFHIKVARLILTEGLTERQKTLIATNPFPEEKEGEETPEPDWSFWDKQDTIALGEMVDSFRSRLGI